MLLDSDTASWSSWNRYGEQFAGDTGARVVHVDDGDVRGPAFFAHVRRLRRPVLNSPKDQNGQLPTDLVRRPIVNPGPYWTWSLVSRRSPTVSAIPVCTTAVWLPQDDPYRRVGSQTTGWAKADNAESSDIPGR